MKSNSHPGLANYLAGGTTPMLQATCPDGLLGQRQPPEKRFRKSSDTGT